MKFRSEEESERPWRGHQKLAISDPEGRKSRRRPAGRRRAGSGSLMDVTQEGGPEPCRSKLCLAHSRCRWTIPPPRKPSSATGNSASISGSVARAVPHPSPWRPSAGPEPPITVGRNGSTPPACPARRPLASPPPRPQWTHHDEHLGDAAPLPLLRQAPPALPPEARPWI